MLFANLVNFHMSLEDLSLKYWRVSTSIRKSLALKDTTIEALKKENLDNEDALKTKTKTKNIKR